jgi:hypothetical protein
MNVNKGVYHKFISNKKPLYEKPNNEILDKKIPEKCQGIKDYLDLCLEVKYIDSKCEKQINLFDQCLKQHQSTN